jgi:hypothetical protein
MKLPELNQVGPTTGRFSEMLQLSMTPKAQGKPSNHLTFYFGSWTAKCNKRRLGIKLIKIPKTTLPSPIDLRKPGQNNYQL